jgi:hypothetical protein
MRAGLRIDSDRVSHGGHGATEVFLADDQAFDAKPGVNPEGCGWNHDTNFVFNNERNCNISQSLRATAASVRGSLLPSQLLFFAFAEDRLEHRSAAAFMSSLQDTNELLLSELVLVELYRLLRNPAVVSKTLSAIDAVKVIQIWRRHPYWASPKLRTQPRRRF